MPTISLTKNEAEFMDYLLLKFMDSDDADLLAGSNDTGVFTQWKDAEKMRKKIKKALLPKLKTPKLPSEAIINIKCNSCSKCHFFNNECLKEKELKNFWGYNNDEFKEYLDARIKGNADECIQFQHRKVFKILSCSNDLYDVEITEDGESEKFLYNIQSLRLFVYKYGKDSFVNYQNYKKILEEN